MMIAQPHDHQDLKGRKTMEEMIHQMFESPAIVLVSMVAGALGVGGLLTLWVAVIAVRDRES